MNESILNAGGFVVVERLRSCLHAQFRGEAFTTFMTDNVKVYQDSGVDLKGQAFRGNGKKISEEGRGAWTLLCRELKNGERVLSSVPVDEYGRQLDYDFLYKMVEEDDRKGRTLLTDQGRQLVEKTIRELEREREITINAQGMEVALEQTEAIGESMLVTQDVAQLLAEKVSILTKAAKPSLSREDAMRIDELDELMPDMARMVPSFVTDAKRNDLLADEDFAEHDGQTVNSELAVPLLTDGKADDMGGEADGVGNAAP